jgi:hypothetical protein
MTQDSRAIARAAYEAYVDKDRAAIEALIADDFHFTSPLDNRLDRATYFARCWPNSETIARPSSSSTWWPTAIACSSRTRARARTAIASATRRS